MNEANEIMDTIANNNQNQRDVQLTTIKISTKVQDTDTLASMNQQLATFGKILQDLVLSPQFVTVVQIETPAFTCHFYTENHFMDNCMYKTYDLFEGFESLAELCDELG